MHELAIQGVPMFEKTVIAETFAMIRHENEESVPGQATFSQSRQERSHLIVGVCQRAIVRIHFPL